jgi:hypothetical protein
MCLLTILTYGFDIANDVLKVLKHRHFVFNVSVIVIVLK